MKVHLPTSVDEVLGLLGEGVLVAGCTGIYPHLDPTDSIISLRRAGLSGVEYVDGDTRARRRDDDAHRSSRARSPFLRDVDRVDRLAHHPQHGHGRRQPVRARSRTATSPSACSRSDAQIEKTDGSLVTQRQSFKVPERWFYTKAMRRKQNSASIVTVASDGVRIALGGVAREPVRALAAEAKLAEGDIDGAAEAALEAADPFDDAYASAWYRRRVLPVHVRRALSQCRLASSRLDVNGSRRSSSPSRARPCSSALRDTLGLTAAKRGCGVGTCGTCTCHVDGEAVMSCLIPVETINGSTVTTLEGTTPADGLSPLQQAFLDNFATQCGFCTPGMIMAAEALLADNPNPTREDVVTAISGNVCRCTGYESIIKAILIAAEATA